MEVAYRDMAALLHLINCLSLFHSFIPKLPRFMLPPAMAAAVARVCEPGHAGVELLLAPRALVPAPSTTSSTPSGAHIAILDSSFNPPTLAHIAMASTLFPPPVTPITPEQDPGAYTARLLLYSARNADKTPKHGDAAPAQRAEMMLLAARSVGQAGGGGSGAGVGSGTGVALVSEPTFVAKSTALVQALSQQQQQQQKGTPPPALTFLVGTDTLVRIFDPKYYPASGLGAALDALFAHAWLVCCARGTADELREQDALLARPDVAVWVRQGKIRLLPPLQGYEDVSSTAVRRAVARRSGLDGLCTTEVEAYIEAQGLYRE